MSTRVGTYLVFHLRRSDSISAFLGGSTGEAAHGRITVSFGIIDWFKTKIRKLKIDEKKMSLSVNSISSFRRK